MNRRSGVKMMSNSFMVEMLILFDENRNSGFSSHLEIEYNSISVRRKKVLSTLLSVCKQFVNNLKQPTHV